MLRSDVADSVKVVHAAAFCAPDSKSRDAAKVGAWLQCFLGFCYQRVHTGGVSAATVNHLVTPAM